MIRKLWALCLMAALAACARPSEEVFAPIEPVREEPVFAEPVMEEPAPPELKRGEEACQGNGNGDGIGGTGCPASEF